MTLARTDSRSFDHQPAHFDRFIELVGGPTNSYVLQRLPAAGHRALDLGCGTGRHAWLLSRVFNEVLAVDLSAPMLQYAQHHRAADNITYEHRDLLDITPDTDGRFDLVISAHTLHHVPDLPLALEQVRSLVQPGGQAILIDNVDPRHRAPRRWFRAEARRALLLDLRHHRRPVREAVELYRLSTDPGWLDHLTTDVFLTREEFTQLYSPIFPGADFALFYRAVAMHWRNREAE